jgi:UDP-N-acetylmuramate: L-alanyl-gamma-D-glutamyl-meso-diaminopimelate ligase
MSAVAKLLKDNGWEVSGSDAGFYPPVSDALTAAGLTCKTPHDPKNIPANVDLIVIGKHAKLVPESNEEVRAAFALEEKGLAEVKSFPEILNQLTLKTNNIVVVGSYGKSTTTALIAWILTASGRDPSYFIGAIPLNMEFSSHSGRSEFFILEGDEYPSSNWDSKPKFLHYNSRTVVLTSCEYDHFNEFKNEDAYVVAYIQLVRTLPKTGLLIACLDGYKVDKVINEAKCRVITYSIDPKKNADYYVDRLERTEKQSSFTICKQGGKSECSKISTSLLGDHNIQNILGAVTTLLEISDLSGQEISNAISTFAGLRRRLELKARVAGTSIYEDLSSSRPKAIAALSAVKEHHPDSNIIAIFQPHTFSFRSRQALNWYPEMFNQADLVMVLSPPNLRGLAPAEELTYEEIVEAIRKGNRCPVISINGLQQLEQQLQSHLKSSNAIVVMSSGSAQDVIDSVIKNVQRAAV